MPELIDENQSSTATPPMGMEAPNLSAPLPPVATSHSIAPPDAIDLVALPTEPLALEPTPLPPFPAPHPHQHASDQKRPVILVTIATIAAVAALGLAWMWSTASSRADEADQEAGAAIVERDAATQALLDNEVELQTLRDQLATAQSELAAVPAVTGGDLSTDPEPSVDVEPSADVAELEATIATLETEVERLTTENTALIEQLENAATPAVVDPIDPIEPEAAEPDVADPVPAPDVPGVADPAPVDPVSETATPTNFDAGTTPEFARYIGELLSSRNGGSRLGQSQSECFGTAVIGQVGLDGLGAGLNNSATSTANNAVVEAMRNAANICSIDAGLIFG